MSEVCDESMPNIVSNTCSRQADIRRTMWNEGQTQKRATKESHERAGHLPGRRSLEERAPHRSPRSNHCSNAALTSCHPPAVDHAISLSSRRRSAFETVAGCSTPNAASEDASYGCGVAPSRASTSTMRCCTEDSSEKVTASSGATA